MKRIICFVIGCMFLAGTAYAGVVKCTVSDVSSNEDNSIVVIVCEPDVKLVVGDNIKVKVKKEVQQQIEGC